MLVGLRPFGRPSLPWGHFMRTASVLASLVLAAATAGTGLVAGPASAATAITCGATVTGAGYLAADLTCPGPGVTITGDSTVNLRGHRLTGTRTAVGITILGAGAVTIRNGRLSNWRTGIASGPSSDEPDSSEPFGSAVIDQVSFQDNSTGLDGSGWIPGAYRSRDVQVKHSRFERNSSGVFVIYGQVDVESSVFVGNSRAGNVITGSLDIQHSVLTNNDLGLGCDETGCLFAHNLLRHNRIGVSSNTFGVTLLDNTITGSDVAYSSNADWGGAQVTGNRFLRNKTAVSIGSASVVTLTGNRFAGNAKAVTSSDTEPAPDPDDAFATRATLTGNRFTHNGDAINLLILATLKDNAAVRNTGWGIYAPNATDLGGNTAHGNGTSPQCTGVVCS
jgi:hypothetical protein